MSGVTAEKPWWVSFLMGDGRRIAALALMIVGAILVLIAFTEGSTNRFGLNISWGKTPRAWQVGAPLLGVGIGLLWLSLASKRGPIPSDFETTISTRVAKLSSGQKALFDIVRNKRGAMQSEVERSFTPRNSEVYYRLEHLRLLGLVRRTNVVESPDAPVWKYQLTEEAAELGGS